MKHVERAKANILMMGSSSCSSKKVKDSEAHDDDSCGLIVWPPKNYNCSFCKREFRSAQALGGHMNVHRRDRARLRMLPPPLPLLEYRNPNPSSSSSSSLSSPPSKLLLPAAGAAYMPKSLVSPRVNSLSSPPSSGFTNEEKKRLLDLCPQQKALTTPTECLRKKKNMRVAVSAGKLKELAISLDLEMGLQDKKKEVLDLELRLGYH